MVEFAPFGSEDLIKLSVNMVKSMIAVPTKTGAMPSDKDCNKFIALCIARKLNPFEGDAFLIGFDSKDGPKFNLITAHQAFLKRAELHKEFDGMKSGVIVERKGQIVELEGDFHLDDDKVVGGWASVHFRTRNVPMTKRLRLKRFQKPFGVWQEDPAGMIVKCAEADALRSSFPTMMGGMYLREEIEVTPEEAGVKKPVFKRPNPVVELPPAKVPETAPALSPLEELVRLAKADGIPEGVLLEFLVDIGMASDSIGKVQELPSDTVLTLIEQWPEFSVKIKEKYEEPAPEEGEQSNG